jgi:plastocyanin
MKRLLMLGLLLALVSVAAVPVPAAVQVPTAVHQTYQVNVGYENANTGTLVEAYFPDTVYIHVGDTVHFAQKTHEIHTVTFLTGTLPPVLDLLLPAPAGSPSPVMFNLAAISPTIPANNLYDGTVFANSGLMSLDPPNPTSFDLIFTKAGTYSYSCLVHGATMSGKVIVLPANKKVPSPDQSAWLAKKQLAEKLSKVGDVVEAAQKLVPHPVHNADGTTTYHVMVGFAKGQIDLVRFFPNKLTVHQGDTVIWDLSPSMPNHVMPPHTVTFLNGNPDPALVVVDPQPSGPPLLLLNPAIVFPAGGAVLSRTGVFNSGVMDPTNPQGPQSYTLKIGTFTGVINYQCLIHDASGMLGSLNVRP